MDQDERRQMENQLLVMGLARLNDPELIQQLAILISAYPGDPHLFFEDMLNQCDADKRYEMYQAIAPKLRFVPKSFTEYEAGICRRADAMVSRGQMRVEGRRPYPIEVDGHKFEGVPEELADAAMATLKCHQCKAMRRYIAATPVDAMIMARKDGWVRDKGLNKEQCAACVKAAADDHRRAVGLPTVRVLNA